MEDSEKQQRTIIVYNNTEGSLERYKEFKRKQEDKNFQEEWKKAFTQLQFDELIQTTFETNPSIL